MSGRFWPLSGRSGDWSQNRKTPEENGRVDISGKGKGAIVSGSCGHLSGQEENGESSSSAEWPRIANV